MVDLEKIYKVLLQDFENSVDVAERIKISRELRSLKNELKNDAFDNEISAKRLAYVLTTIMRDIDKDEGLAPEMKEKLINKLKSVYEYC